MKGKFLPILILIFKTFTTVAQEDFRKGYIIKINMDTLYGYINYNGTKYYDCVFKDSLKGIEIIYKPFEIYGYRFIDGKYFISKSVTLKKSYRNNQELENSSNYGDKIISKTWYDEDGTKEHKVFLEYLFNGILNLYYFKDDKSIEHYLISKQKDTIIDLTPDEISIYQNGSLTGTVKDEKYKSKLHYLMKDYPPSSA